MTSTQPTRKCSHCGERFALTPRRGRNSGRRPPHAKQSSLHKGARYCSTRCRQAAYEARRTRVRSSSVGQNAPKNAEGGNPLSSIGQVENSAVTSMPCGGKELGRGSLKNLDSRIVPAARWPGMYRIRLPGGELTDIVNLTRAKDALAALDERVRP
jgi:hypothetical protein